MVNSPSPLYLLLVLLLSTYHQFFYLFLGRFIVLQHLLAVNKKNSFFFESSILIFAARTTLGYVSILAKRAPLAAEGFIGANAKRIRRTIVASPGTLRASSSASDASAPTIGTHHGTFTATRLLPLGSSNRCPSMKTPLWLELATLRSSKNAPLSSTLALCTILRRSVSTTTRGAFSKRLMASTAPS